MCTDEYKIPEALLSKPYIKYAIDVIDDVIPAGEYIKLACKRMLSRFSREDMYFDYEYLDKKIKLVSKLKHWSGQFSGKPFILLPWQQWAFANIYAWKWTSDNTRVTTDAFIIISRKNGKTALASSIAIIGSLESDGAEVDLIANSRQQATIAFEMCKNFSNSADPKNSIFKRYRDSIKVPKKKSVIQVLASDSMTLDGYGSDVTIIDEFHAAKDWSLYNVMR